MKKYSLLSIALLLIIHVSAWAQNDEQSVKKKKKEFTDEEVKVINSFDSEDLNPTRKPQPFFQRIKIRKAFESADDRDEPAIASFTMPMSVRECQGVPTCAIISPQFVTGDEVLITSNKRVQKVSKNPEVWTKDFLRR